MKNNIDRFLNRVLYSLYNLMYFSGLYSFVASMVAAASDKPRRVWVVADALPIQERLAAEWPLWEGPQAVFVPEQEIHINHGVSDPDLAAERLEALRAIACPPKSTQAVIVTAAALQQPAPSFAAGAGFTLTLQVGHEYLLDDMCTALTDHDFERVDQVTGRGEWSLRGGILDVFPLQSAWPLRIEFFGDEVESIRAFDIDSQLSFKKLDSADLVLEEPPADRPLRDWIGRDDWVVSLPGCGVSHGGVRSPENFSGEPDSCQSTEHRPDHQSGFPGM